MRRRQYLPAHVVRVGADERRAASRRLENALQQEGGRALAIGSSDAGDGQLARGMTIEIRAQAGQRASAMCHSRPGNVRPALKAGVVADDSNRAPANGGVYESVSVAAFSSHGDESATRRHAARVILQPADVGVA